VLASTGIGWNHLLMEPHMEPQNPEDRIAELERQLAEQKRIAEPGFSLPPQAGFPPPPVGWPDPAQTPLLGPHRTANAGSKTGPGRRSMGIGGWLFAIVFVGLGLYFLSFSARQFYGYQVGTPTTATGIECRYGVPGSSDPGAETGFFASTFMLSEGCTAAWSVAGQSQTGPIVGVQHLGSADVHVNGGTAFTAPTASWFFGGHLLGGLFLIAVLGLGRLWDIGRLWSWMKPGPKRPAVVGDLPPPKAQEETLPR
jgi:hypothetical protein